MCRREHENNVLKIQVLIAPGSVLSDPEWIVLSSMCWLTAFLKKCYGCFESCLFLGVHGGQFESVFIFKIL